MLKQAFAALAMSALVSVPALAAGTDFIAFDVQAPALTQKFVDLVNDGHTIKKVALFGDTGSVILFDHNSYWAAGIPAELTTKLDEIAATDQEIKSLTFNANGGFVLLYGAHETFTKGVDESLLAFLQQESAVEFRDVVFPEGGGLVVLEADGKFAFTGLAADSALAQALQNQTQQQDVTRIDSLIVTPAGGFVAIADGKITMRQNISESLSRHIDELQCGGNIPLSISFLGEDRWFMVF